MLTTESYNLGLPAAFLDMPKQQKKSDQMHTPQKLLGYGISQKHHNVMKIDL